jgi:polyhydroxyalkanoate synthesis regulator phasin
MKRFWTIAGAATLVAVLGAVAVVGVVAAQEPSEGWPAWASGFPQQMKEAVASALGISVDEYDAAVETARDKVLERAVTEGHLTQEQADRMRERMGQRFEFGPGMRGRGAWGPGMMGPVMGWADAENSPMALAAEALGMTADELLAELRDGKSIADVANERGVDPQTIADSILANMKDKLAQAVADGKITQEQADHILSRMEERHLDLDCNIPFGGLRFGRMGGWGHRLNKPF